MMAAVKIAVFLFNAFIGLAAAHGSNKTARDKCMLAEQGGLQ